MADDTQKPPQELDKSQLIKLAIELGPLLVFLGVLLVKGIYTATAVLMVLSVLAVIASRVLLGHVTRNLIITTVLVLVFGGLTVGFNDARFIKIKPTIANLMFAAVLLGGVAFGKPLLRYVMGEALQLTDRGWRLLSIRFGVFFIVLAILNEIVWRNFSDTVWGGFKVGILPLTLLFFATQLGTIQAHRLEDKEQSNNTA